ncbi:hypothetical protein [Nocardiopsis gilva]|uniref:hypothetical protein n=1 Tax=Nocardiopsis gilva TaxID=280236 RepID=UPI000345A7E6|nr:hypothetical protein [Nocardiopsis gilva]
MTDIPGPDAYNEINHHMGGDRTGDFLEGVGTVLGVVAKNEGGAVSPETAEQAALALQLLNGLVG